jgi:hypothetical protein
MNELSIDNIINSPILKSKFLDPNYLLDSGLELLLLVQYYLTKKETLDFLREISSIFLVFFLVIIFYVIIRMLELRDQEKKHLAEEIVEYAHHQAERAKKQGSSSVSKNEKWNKVIQNLNSSNMSDWKLAVIESDAILESLLTLLGFKGESLGDKLKNADPDKFRNLSIAWEVHAVRNRIAHQADFDLSPREAKRIISLYQQIFQESGFI